MKTILIIIGGMADISDWATEGKTPLMLASTPSLDSLAKVGCCGTIRTVPDGAPVTTEAAMLTLLGYDFERGVPSRRALETFGCGFEPVDNALRYFIVPKFSGHGVVISDSPLARGVGRMALMRPYIPIDDDGMPVRFPLEYQAQVAVKAIESYDFVLMYVGLPHERSLAGDLDGKIEALERIDRELITPVADYVWNSKFQMNLVVTGDHVSSWRKRCIVPGEVPAVVYFNDDLPYDTGGFNEESVVDGPLNAPLPGDLIKRLISFEPFIDDPSTPTV